MFPEAGDGVRARVSAMTRLLPAAVWRLAAMFAEHGRRCGPAFVVALAGSSRSDVAADLDLVLPIPPRDIIRFQVTRNG